MPASILYHTNQIERDAEYMTINLETAEIIHAVANGKTEEINNKIKTTKRQSYGFRDVEYFKLRLYNLHKAKYSFV